MNVRFNQKAILALVIVFLSMVTFLGCQSTETITDNTSGDIEEISVSAIYGNLVEYKERIDHILVGHVSNEETEEAMDMSVRLLTAETLPEGAEKYSREDMLESFLFSASTREFELYYGELDHTGDFITGIIDFIDENEGIVLNQVFFPNPQNDKMYYKFIACNDEYVIIQKNSESENLYIKIGFNESDALKFQQINYSYDSDSDLSKVEECIRFNYFEFEEGIECLYMNSLGTRGSVNYTSLVDDLVISVSYDENIVEGFETGGYIVSYYDASQGYEYIVTISEGEILSECYDIYNEHGYLYRYEDYDTSDQQIYLSTNFIEATGWDYLIGSNQGVNDEINEVTGIFKNDGTALYQGYIPCYMSEHYTIAQLKRTISLDTLTDSEINLANYGMVLDDERASLEYLNSIKVTDSNSIIPNVVCKGINLFNEHKQLELYSYLDDDIRLIIEGLDEEPIQTTGDVDAFNTALNLHLNEQNHAGKVVSENIHRTYTEMNGETTNTTWYSGNKVDFDSLYYYSYIYGQGIEPIRSVCTEFNGKLVSFSSKGGNAIDYDIVSNQATEASFTNYLTSLSGTGSDLLEHTISVEKVSTNTFNLVLNQSIFGLVHVMDDLYTQQGIGGFRDSTIEAVMTFDDDYQGYSLNITLSGLYLIESTDVLITNTTLLIVTLADFDLVDPLTIGSSLVMPTLKEDILFDFEVDESYGISYGYKTSYWIRMELEPGYYRLNRDDLYTVYDEQDHMIHLGQYLIIENAGTYFFELYADRNGSSIFILEKVPNRISHNYDLDNQSGYIEMAIEEGLNDYFLNIPSSIHDRLVKIILPDNTNMEDVIFFNCQEFLNGATYGKDYWGLSMNIYFIVPANETMEITVGGYYFGEISFDYEYIDLPASSGIMPSQDLNDINDFPDVILTPEVNESRVDFTVTESGEYRIDIDYYNFGGANVRIDLYHSDGSILSGDCERRSVDLEAGDYYYVFSLDQSYEVNSVVIISNLSYQAN